MTTEQQINHWKERALRAERALDDLYVRVRDYAAPRKEGPIEVMSYGERKIGAIKAFHGKVEGSLGLRECMALINSLPHTITPLDGRGAEIVRALDALAEHGVRWRHVG